MTFWVKQTTQWENKRNHSYHTCKFDIDWISIQNVLLKISKINANLPLALFGEGGSDWRPCQNDQKLVFKTNYPLMQVKSIAECYKLNNTFEKAWQLSS